MSSDNNNIKVFKNGIKAPGKKVINPSPSKPTQHALQKQTNKAKMPLRMSGPSQKKMKQQPSNMTFGKQSPSSSRSMNRAAVQP